MTDAEILAIVEPLMDNCLAGSTERDHAKHVRDFTDRLRAIVTPENLAAQLESGQPTNGYFAERELIGIFAGRAASASSGASFSQRQRASL